MSPPADGDRSTLTCANAPGRVWRLHQITCVDRVLLVAGETRPLIDLDDDELSWVERGFHEFDRCEPAVCGERAVDAAADPPVLEEDLGLEDQSSRWLFKRSSRRRPLNDSIQEFCQGPSGSLNAGAGAIEAPPVDQGAGDEPGPMVEAHRCAPRSAHRPPHGMCAEPEA